ncbi:MAG TPA: AlkA N-terminal domain-containing protein [Steroidobacteraceae bacterium]|nr:AlkA N-terminal domain-containing protein [Steroidobacteraceae bacterium]
MTDIHGLDQRALDRARRSRDPRFDGRFFIAVTSTGIYCRPVCPSRTCKSANVRYYPTAAAAAEAGYRPCLRCRPEAAPGTPAWLGTSAVVHRALRLIDNGALDESSVESLAARLGVGSRHLHRLFLRFVGASPVTVAQTRRLHFAKHLLDETRLPVTEIALASGYGSIRRFNTVFRQVYGRSPRELRRRPPGSAATAALAAARTAAPKAAAKSTRDGIILKLAYRPPYPWAQVAEFLATRALPGVERVDSDSYTRAVALPSGPAIVRVRPVKSEDAIELRVTGAPASALLHLSRIARRVFDLAADPAAIAQVFRSDALLGPLVKQQPGMRVPGAWDPFECVVRAILGQQVTVAAGRTLTSRVVLRAGRPLETPIDGLTHVFPSAADLAAAELSGIGITGARIGALKALSQAVLDGRLDFSAPPAEVAAALASLPGIGEWTAQYVSLRALGEPDIFMGGDLILRRMVGEGGKELAPRAAEARAEPWRPWRSYAVMHLWRLAAMRAAARTASRAAA